MGLFTGINGGNLRGSLQKNAPQRGIFRGSFWGPFPKMPLGGVFLGRFFFGGGAVLKAHPKAHPKNAPCKTFVIFTTPYLTTLSLGLKYDCQITLWVSSTNELVVPFFLNIFELSFLATCLKDVGMSV